MNTLQTNNWNYEESVNKIKPIVLKWKTLTLEIIKEIWIAKGKLINQGFRSDLTSSNNGRSWETYCKDIGISKQTGYNWLERYYPEENRLLTFSELKQKKQIEHEKNKQTNNDSRKVNMQNVHERIKDIKKDKEWQELKAEAFQDIKQETNYSDMESLLNNEFLKEKEKEQFRNKINEGNKYQSTFFDIIDKYLLELKTDSERLEAINNIIKYCKKIAIKYQQKSINT